MRGLPDQAFARALVGVIPILVVAALVACRAPGEPDVTGLTEASTNFDLENVKPFLQRLSPHVDGFGPAQIDPLVAEISAMAVDAERSWSFEVVHGGKAAPFHVVVHMDDVDAPDVYFFTTPELAAAIDREMAAFFEELGL